MSKSSRYFS